jgi:hypothetical protein
MKKSSWSLLIFGILIVIILIILIVKSTPNKISYWPSSNVDAVKNSCAIACSNNNSYDYCYQLRVVDDRKNSKFSDTCYNLANSDNYSDGGYDIQLCPQIDCFVAG